MYFCGLSLSDDVPDETTLCRFRNRLITAGKLAGLLAGVNGQLQGHGLMVKCAHGAVIDATLVQSAARPKRDMVVELDAAGAPKVNEDGSIPGSMAMTSPNWLAVPKPGALTRMRPGSRRASKATLATAAM